MEELRCDSKKFGELFQDVGILEVKCSSRFCGARPGVVVIHSFDIQSGKLVDTKSWADPATTMAGKDVEG